MQSTPKPNAVVNLHNKMYYESFFIIVKYSISISMTYEVEKIT
jgi:hypothetical protein